MDDLLDMPHEIRFIELRARHVDGDGEAIERPERGLPFGQLVTRGGECVPAERTDQAVIFGNRSELGW